MRGQKRDKKGQKKGQSNTHIIGQLGSFVPLSLKKLYRDIVIMDKPHRPHILAHACAHTHTRIGSTE